MPTWTPDPSFYPSPRTAMKAAPETLAYVAAFDPDRKTPDAIAVVDVDAGPPTYSQIIGTTPMPNAGDELHYFGWNACSSCLCVRTRPMRMPSGAISSFPACAHRASTSPTPGPIPGVRKSPR